MATISPNVVRSLGEKAMISRLNVSKHGNQKFDRNISRETNMRLGAEEDSGRFNKPLVRRKNPVVAQVTRTYGLLRNYHNNQTIPWDDNGGRLLSALKYNEFCRNLRGYIDEYTKAFNVYIDRWDELVAEAQRKHGRMFKLSEYPTQEEVRNSKFGVYHSFDLIPSGNNSYDIRDISDEDRERIAEEIDKRVSERLEESMKEPWKRLHEAVSRVVDTLSDPVKGFHKTMLTNIVELVQVMSSLNIGEIPELDYMTQQIQYKLAYLDIPDLKTDKYYREDAAKEAQKILDDIGAFYTP